MVNPLRSLPGRLPSLTGIHDPTLHKNDSLEPHMLEFVSRELRVGGVCGAWVYSRASCVEVYCALYCALCCFTVLYCGTLQSHMTIQAT